MKKSTIGCSNYTIYMQKAKSWHRSTGLEKRQAKREKAYGQTMKEIEDERKEIGNIRSTHPDYKYSIIKWGKKKKVRQRLDQLVEKVLPKDGKTLVLYGNGAKTSATKG